MCISGVLRFVLLFAISIGMQAQTVDVATIKPTAPEVQDEWFTIRGHRVVTLGTSLTELIKFAYGMHPSQIVGATSWMTKDRFDIDAVVATSHDLNNDDMRVVIRELLTQRFHLEAKTETGELPVFTMTLVRDDRKLAKTAKQPGQPVDIYGSRGELNVRNASMDDFATGLSRGMLSRPVVNQTGLRDRYDFTLHWTPDSVNAPDPNEPPDMVSALPDEVGLKLKAATAKVPVMRIESAQHPSQD